MDTLHTVLRSIQSDSRLEAKARRDHLDVFREFLNHLDRAARRKGGDGTAERATKVVKTSTRAGVAGKAKRGKR